MKKLFQWLLVLTLLTGLTACGENSENSTTYCYSVLSRSEKDVIDGVLAEYDTWQLLHGDLKDFYCTNFTFVEEDGVLLFVTCYRDSNYEGIADGVLLFDNATYRIFEVDSYSGALSEHTYSVHDSYEKKNELFSRAFAVASFDDALSEAEKRERLADEYYMKIILEAGR